MKKLLLLLLSILMFVISGCGGTGSSDEIVPSADTALSEETERNSCLSKADQLIQNGQYGEAMSLLKEEWRKTKDSSIDAKICEMYENNLLEDVTSTLDQPVAQSVSDVNGNERNYTKLDYTFSAILNHNLKYDCYTWDDEYKLAYFCIKGYCPEFFQWANPEFQWKVEHLNSTYSEKSSYHEHYVASGEKVDWFLKNVFNFQPSHTLNEEREGMKIYYSDNEYHLKALGTGRGYPTYQVFF